MTVVIATTFAEVRGRRRECIRLQTLREGHMRDDHLLNWLPLLPPDAVVSPWNVPVEFRLRLEYSCDRSGDTWLGWRPARNQIPLLKQFQAVVLVNPQGITPAQLHAAGFAHIRSFAVVPSIDDPRWFIPLESQPAALRAWDFYTPFRMSALVYKKVARLITRLGILPGLTDHLIIAQRHASALEEALGRAVNTEPLILSLASGSGSRPKMKLQLMAENGAIRGYAKFATLPSAVALLQQESHILDLVARLGLRAASVPKLLYHGPCNGGYLVVTQAIGDPQKRTATSLTPGHIDILRELASHMGSKPTVDLLKQLWDRVSVLQQNLDATWYKRLVRAIGIVATVPGISALPTALSHGDFTPWNMCLDRRTNQLILFDWELGRLDQFLLWDMFHFETQVFMLLRQRSGAKAVATTLAKAVQSSLVRNLKLTTCHVGALYVAYLIEASVQWFEEQQRANDVACVDIPMRKTYATMLDVAVQALLASLNTPYIPHADPAQRVGASGLVALATDVEWPNSAPQGALQ